MEPLNNIFAFSIATLEIKLSAYWGHRCNIKNIEQAHSGKKPEANDITTTSFNQSHFLLFLYIPIYDYNVMMKIYDWISRRVFGVYRITIHKCSVLTAVSFISSFLSLAGTFLSYDVQYIKHSSIDLFPLSKQLALSRKKKSLYYNWFYIEISISHVNRLVYCHSQQFCEFSIRKNQIRNFCLQK